MANDQAGNPTPQDLERAYRQGRAAMNRLDRRDTNPHPYGSAPHAAWERGWDDMDCEVG